MRPTMYVSADGTGVPMVAQEWKGRRGQQADGAERRPAADSLIRRILSHTRQYPISHFAVDFFGRSQ
jgi:hypothetical protein